MDIRAGIGVGVLSTMLVSCAGSDASTAETRSSLETVAETTTSEPLQSTPSEPAPEETVTTAEGILSIQEIPGEEIATAQWNNALLETVLRVTEADVPELAEWIADYARSTGLQGKFLDPDQLASQQLWDQADHRGSMLELAVVGGLLGDEEIPTSPDGGSLDVSVLPSLKAFGDEEESDEQLLYVLGSGAQSLIFDPEELIAMWRDLPEQESLVILLIERAPAN